jgi:hypothetical protein
MSRIQIRERFNDSTNIHELLKETLLDKYPKKYPEVNENEDSEKFINHFIMLDSYLKIRNSATQNGEFDWVFNTRGQSSNEMIGVFENIDFVTEIQIGSFFIPILEDITYINPQILTYGAIELVQNNSNPEFELAPTLVRKGIDVGQYPEAIFIDPTSTYKMPWINNPYTQIPFYNRITVQIKEANLQTYMSRNNVRFSFEMEAAYSTRLGTNPSFVEVNPINSSWDTYLFLNPLRNLNTLSLIFRNPDIPISFEPDVMYSSVISLTVDPLGGGSHITIFTQYTHKLLAGDRIFLQNFSPTFNGSGFNSNFPIYLTNYINRPEGHVINIVIGTAVTPGIPGSPIPGTSFCLDPSIKIIDPISPNISASFPGIVDVFIAKRRLRIPIKIKCIKNIDNKNIVD